MRNDIANHYLNRDVKGRGVFWKILGAGLGGILIMGGASATTYAASPSEKTHDPKASYQKAIEILNLSMGIKAPNMTENYGKTIYKDTGINHPDGMMPPNPFKLNGTVHEEVQKIEPKTKGENWKNFNLTDASMHPGPQKGSVDFMTILESQELFANATVSEKVGKPLTDDPKPVKQTDFNNGYKNRLEKIGNVTSVENGKALLRFVETYGNVTNPDYKKR